jgi:hypothetical protein
VGPYQGLLIEAGSSSGVKGVACHALVQSALRREKRDVSIADVSRRELLLKQVALSKMGDNYKSVDWYKVVVNNGGRQSALQNIAVAYRHALVEVPLSFAV